MEARIYAFAELHTAAKDTWTAPLHVNVFVSDKDRQHSPFWTNKADAEAQAKMVRPAYRLNVRVKAA